MKDFAEKKAEVVHVDNGTAYVNIGDESNIRVGELFVLTEEQKLQGINDSEKPFSVKKNIGIYRVMQSKTNFSLIRAVNTDREISVGDTVILNHNLKAVFIDTTGRSESTFVELRKALPNLIWLNYKAVKSEAEIKNFISKSEAEADLFIIAKENTINVRDRDQQLIYGYSIPVEPLVTKHTPNVSNAPLPFLANLHRKYLGSVNKRITASDFVAYDDKAYILATDGASLSVYSIENSLNVIAVLDDDFPGTIISVKWWVPNSAALPKAVVSVWKNKQLSHQDMLLESYILTFDQLKLTVERRNIPYILSSFDLNNDGQKEVLLAQSYSNTNFFGNKIKQALITADSIQYKELTFALPKGFTVTGSTIDNLNGNTIFESITIDDGQLLISSGEEIKLRRTAGYGGSLASVLYEFNTEMVDALHQTAAFEIAPVSIDINNDGTREFITPRVHDKPFGFSFGIGRNYEYRFEVFYIDHSGQFSSTLLPINVFGRIQGMTALDRRLLVLINDVETSNAEDGGTILISYDL